MATPVKQVIQPNDLGKGLKHNTITSLIDVSVSSDLPNNVSYGNDNGLVVDVLSVVVGEISTEDDSVLDSSDSIFDSFGKIQAQINTIVNNKFNVSNIDTDHVEFIYYGGLLGSGAWQINRWSKSLTTKSIANLTNNSETLSLPTAWNNRTTLTFS